MRLKLLILAAVCMLGGIALSLIVAVGGHHAQAEPAGTFTQVSAGGYHTCGVETYGTLACWGQNGYGQATPPSGTFSQVSAGEIHTCGVRTYGTVACWGWNDYGQAAPPGGAFSQVSAGYLHTCGVKTDGTVACWGWNSYGMATPPGGTFSEVSAGSYHNCGVRTDGTLACWGDNTNGQATPPGGTFSQVSAGTYHACALRTDGTVACWGSNYYGQAAPPGGTFTQVDAGAGHTCGVRTGGTVACWGSNYDGQATPPGGTFSQVSAGDHYTCGLKTDGTVACWGQGYSATRTSTPTPTATNTPAPGQAPDLVVEDIGDAQQPFDCVTPAGVKVVVRNIGSFPAGPSTTYLSVASGGDASLAIPGLAAGEAAELLFNITGIPLGDTYTAVADWENVVSETNETNNSLSMDFGLATLPTCTATPAPASTPTPTPTSQKGLHLTVEGTPSSGTVVSLGQPIQYEASVTCIHNAPLDVVVYSSTDNIIDVSVEASWAGGPWASCGLDILPDGRTDAACGYDQLDPGSTVVMRVAGNAYPTDYNPSGPAKIVISTSPLPEYWQNWPEETFPFASTPTPPPADPPPSADPIGGIAEFPGPEGAAPAATTGRGSTILLLAVPLLLLVTAAGALAWRRRSA